MVSMSDKKMADVLVDWMGLPLERRRAAQMAFLMANLKADELVGSRAVSRAAEMVAMWVGE